MAVIVKVPKVRLRVTKPFRNYATTPLRHAEAAPPGFCAPVGYRYHAQAVMLMLLMWH